MKNNSVRTNTFSWVSLPLLFFGAGVIAYRMKQGLGASTHLSDTFPWGLWISVDVLCGVALAAGAFTVAAAVYIFNLKPYRPILRPAILTGFLGYLLVIVALFIDIGRPFRIWHPLILWNPNSVMFEVAWCVILYSTVLAMEFAPIVLERFGLKRLLRILDAVTIPLVIAGVILSTLHQSSLGSLYLIVPSKLHPLWYSRMVPLFFFVSALAGGLCVLIIEGTVSQRVFHHHVDIHVLRGLARAAVVVLILYGAMKISDLMFRGGLSRLAMDREGIFFGMEIMIGIVLPLLLYALPGIRETRQGLFAFACLGVTGLILNRINVSLIGMAGSSGTSYFPSWMEFAITATLILAGVALFRWAARSLPVFEKQA
ncbi:MAG: NrfD/PsrC family molybdoenzyme membrane anchor subunit [bacterium]|mgnify:CR=1 FL=1